MAYSLLWGRIPCWELPQLQGSSIPTVQTSQLSRFKIVDVRSSNVQQSGDKKFSSAWNRHDDPTLFKQQRQLDSDLDSLDRESIGSLLKNCTALSEGMLIHSQTIKCGFQGDTYMGNLLIGMYSRCGLPDYARFVFDDMQRNVVSWNAIISVYSQHDLADEALQLYCLMLTQGMEPNHITFITILGACACPAALAHGWSIHAEIVNRGFHSNVVVGNALVSMYGNCGALRDAVTAFEKMHMHNVVSWTAIIMAFSQHGHDGKAIQLFQQMQNESVEPDQITIICVLNACASPDALAEGKAIHASVSSGQFDVDPAIGNALVSMYSRCGSLDDARAVFNKLPQCNVVSWTAMITAYSQHGLEREALQLFHQMQHNSLEPDKVAVTSALGACISPAALPEGTKIHASIMERGLESDVVVATALVNMYGKCGAVDAACLMFNKINQYNTASWNAMIGAYSLHGYAKDALELFQHMQQLGVEPDEITFVSTLNLFASPAALQEGYAIHARIIWSGLKSSVVENALINMYIKCGAVEAARIVFDKLHQLNITSWNTMFAAYSKHGCSKHVLQLYQEMQQAGMDPDHVTFICLLSACSHAGLVVEGHIFFSSMIERYSIEPTLGHYNCMVDLLGRAGQLEAAENTIRNMPLRADALVWTTLLGACRMHGDVERGDRIADHIFQLDPENAAAHVLLSNVYAEREVALNIEADIIEVFKRPPVALH